VVGPSQAPGGAIARRNHAPGLRPPTTWAHLLLAMPAYSEEKRTPPRACASDYAPDQAPASGAAAAGHVPGPRRRDEGSAQARVAPRGWREA
jgi:hypothetical protein